MSPRVPGTLWACGPDLRKCLPGSQQVEGFREPGGVEGTVKAFSLPTARAPGGGGRRVRGPVRSP